MEQPKKRVNYDNIKVIFNAEANVDKHIIDNFQKIPYKKVLLTSNVENVDDCVNLTCHQKGYDGPLVVYRNKFFHCYRFMDEYNWIKFLNE